MNQPDEAPLGLYQRYASELVAQLDASISGWVIRAVSSIFEAWAGAPPHPEVASAAATAAVEARAEVVPAVQALVEADPEAQPTNPLALLRGAVRYPTAVLAAAGVPPVVRDAFAERAFPEDAYNLAPAAFADIDPALHEVGLAWGAAKAHVVLTRRRAPR